MENVGIAHVEKIVETTNLNAVNVKTRSNINIFGDVLIVRSHFLKVNPMKKKK
jgi:hypothetical protein